MIIELKDAWYDAVRKRKSRRSFASELSESQFQRMQEFCTTVNSAAEGVRIALVDNSDTSVFTGALGPIGKIQGTRSFAAFIGNTNDPHMYEKVGYAGEAFILEAADAGIDTCWVAGLFSKEKVKDLVKLEQGEVVCAVTPLGLAKASYSLGERLLCGMIGSRKRKDLESMCVGLSMERRPDWLQCSLEAARLAPSAMNRQPWMFHAADDAVMISVAGEGEVKHLEGKRLDCGIAMLHLELGARHKKALGNWKFLELPEVAIFEKL